MQSHLRAQKSREFEVQVIAKDRTGGKSLSTNHEKHSAEDVDAVQL